MPPTQSGGIGANSHHPGHASAVASRAKAGQACTPRPVTWPGASERRLGWSLDAKARRRRPRSGAKVEEVVVSRIRRLVLCLIGLVGAFVTSADAQNIDAGKSPAQIFSDTCAACHRNARELRRTSTSFLRSHYTTGQEEAAAMSSYLASVAVDPRAAQQKRTPGTAGITPADAAKQSPRQQAPGDQARTTPGQPAGKGARRQAPSSLEARPVTAAAPEEKLPEPAPAPDATATATPAPVVSAVATPVPAPARPKPVLEPFEE